MHKYLIPISIIVGAIIIGSFYYLATRTNHQIPTPTPNPSQMSAQAIYNAQKSLLPPHQLYCIPERKVSCSIDKCENVDANVFVLIDESRGNFTISRCDNKPCDTYPATPYFSGAFMEVRTNTNHGMLFKTSTLDQSFVEVVTLGTDTLTSYGHCYKND